MPRKTRLNPAQRAEVAAQLYIQLPTVAAMLYCAPETINNIYSAEEAAEVAVEIIEACLDQILDP